VNDTLYEGSHENKFERETHTIRFNYSCVNHISENNVYFRYKLEGAIADEWSPLQKTSQLELKQMAPGSYTLSIQTLDAFNDREPITAVCVFEIKPYFYETTGFKILVICLLIIITFLLGVLVVKRRRAAKEEKEFFSKKLSQIELKAIQSQLNPHFVFNCMNTIKLFITEKDFENANKGLTKLAKLLRTSLEGSDAIFTSLEDELNIINNYVELEKMRKLSNFEYELYTSDEIALNTMVPSLIIQPYVENCIKHGFPGLNDRQGLLKLKLFKDSKNLICEIEDNGIGREASSQNKSKTHVSKGTNLTNEKSFFLKKYLNYEVSIETIDLYNDFKSAGTLVIIRLPLNYESNYSR
jgi:hypothetical protein